MSLKLNLGCGSAKLGAGWTNVDSDPGNRAEVTCDLTRVPLPWADGTVDYIHMEHFFEHINRAQQQVLLGECHRILKRGGVIRINGPDLQKIAALYLSGNVELWRSRSNAPCETICDFMNDVFYNWGHRYIPDPPQLALMLSRAGFCPARLCEYGKSDVPELCDVEVRGGSRNEDFVMEATK